MVDVDVVIVGGGPAGLSAALLLGRCRRRVLVCDDGKQRNTASHAIHALLGREGTAPAAFLREARQDLGRYASVTIRATRVLNVRRMRDAFWFECADGTMGAASKVLLTSGLVDEVPDLPDIDAYYGSSVHHCLYCDGFEYAGKTVAAYGKGDKGADLAVMMKHWIADVVACSDGNEVSDDTMRKLQRHGIALRTEVITALEGTDGRLSRLRFADGRDLELAGLFFSTGCRQGSDLAERLGCERDARGGIVTEALTEETSVPGVYVAGDASRDVLLVAVAIGEGAKAAVAINKAFLRHAGLCD
jgi:thioredoxin reductase